MQTRIFSRQKEKENKILLVLKEHKFSGTKANLADTRHTSWKREIFSYKRTKIIFVQRSNKTIIMKELEKNHVNKKVSQL